MRRAALTLLAALGVAAGLAVTASSTSHQAYEAGMRGLALAALVVVLEVTNTLGTLVWLTDVRPHAKWQAGVLVACSSAVTAVCGALTYGPIGLVGPFFVLAGVHLANLAATTTAQPGPLGVGADGQPPAQPGSISPNVPVHRHAEASTDPASMSAIGPMTDTPSPTEAPSPPAQAADAQPTPAQPAQGEAPSPEPRLGDEEIAAQLLARPIVPGRDAVCREFRCGKTKAERVLALVADRRRPHLVTAEEATS